MIGFRGHYQLGHTHEILKKCPRPDFHLYVRSLATLALAGANRAP